MRRVILPLGVVALLVVVAGCGGGGGGNGTTEATTATTTTAPGETGNATKGKEVFTSAGCGACHTFSAAGSTGSIGPNLDDASPSFDTVVSRVRDGRGVMPSFADKLSEQQIRDVAAFVSGS